MFLADKFRERARTHTRSEWRGAVRALDVEFFCLAKKILHEGNYGVLLMQAIKERRSPVRRWAICRLRSPRRPSAHQGRSPRLEFRRQDCLRHDLETGRRPT